MTRYMRQNPKKLTCNGIQGKSQVVHQTIQESGWTRVDKAAAQTFHYQQVIPFSLLASSGALYVMMHHKYVKEASASFCIFTQTTATAL